MDASGAAEGMRGDGITFRDAVRVSATIRAPDEAAPSA
jgi:hypothetical protein